MKKSVAIACITLLTGLSATAFAGHCPVDMKAIDAALSTNKSLSAEKTAEVQKLRAEGEAAHKAGNHAESMAKLAQAKTILGI